MALLNKLFSSKKKNHRSHFILFGKSENESWIPFDFNPEQVRVLLFRECESRRRKILFDSSSIQKIPLDKPSCRHSARFGTTSQRSSDTKKTDSVFLEVTNGYGYKYTRPNDELNLDTISDMIFGTVPLNFQGTSMKVHSLKSPARLMCTKVFPSPSTGHGQRVSEHSLDDSVGGGSSLSSLGEAVDVAALSESGASSFGDIDLGRGGGGGLQKRASEEDSGFCGDASLRSISLGSNSNPWLLNEYNASFDSKESSYSSLGSWLPNHSSGSMSSLQRRWCRYLTTSMEMCPSQCGGYSSSSGGRRSKLGLAVMLHLSKDDTMEMQEQSFFFEHTSVIESIINRLRGMVEKAWSRRDMFHHLLKEGADELKQSMVDLFSAPRLPKPVWLSLMSAATPSAQSSLANTFLGELCNLLASLDTKSANFFISTLVTSVLTHHLGWVPTVLPGTSPPLSKDTDQSANQMLDSLAKSHPYNALWAQLGDLQGALGHPLRVSRTIITGRRAELLDQLVRVLSYFIRCGTIKEIHEERSIKDIDDHRLLLPVLPPYHDRDLSFCTMKPSVSLSTLTTNKNMDSSSSTIVPLAETSNKSLGMHRTSSCLTQLVSEQKNTGEPPPSSSTSLYPSLATEHSDLDLINEKVSKLCRVPTEAIMCHLKSLVSESRGKVNSEKQMSSSDYVNTNVPTILFNDEIKTGTEQAQDVIFVLGEDEKLVNIKSKNNSENMSESQEEMCGNIKETSLYLKSYHSVRFHSERCDEGEDCCLMLGGVKEEEEDDENVQASTFHPFDTDDSEDELQDRGPQLVELPLPTSNTTKPASSANTFAASLLGCASEHYIADFVVQACTQDSGVWKHKLRRDLALAAHQPMFDKEVAEAICVVANTDTWEVQVVSSHTYVVDQPGTLGVRQGMSQLVANMLESVQHLWKLHTPPEHCLQHLESKLREICLQSHALAQLLLATDCCEMQQLTSALNLEANDVPLLLAVASTHSPQVTQRYGLSFR